MRRQEQPIAAFRRWSLRLIDEQCEGKYTSLARRAGIATSTMEHYTHHAKHLPGGEHLQKLAAALGVTVRSLFSGEEVTLAAAPRTHPTPGDVPREGPPPRGSATHLSIPVFACGCPGPCPLTGPVPLPRTARARVVVELALVAGLRSVVLHRGRRSAPPTASAYGSCSWRTRMSRHRVYRTAVTASETGHLTRGRQEGGNLGSCDSGLTGGAGIGSAGRQDCSCRCIHSAFDPLHAGGHPGKLRSGDSQIF